MRPLNDISVSSLNDSGDTIIYKIFDPTLCSSDVVTSNCDFSCWVQTFSRDGFIAAVALVTASSRELFPNYHRANDVTSHVSTLRYYTSNRRISSQAVALYLLEKSNCPTLRR